MDAFLNKNKSYIEPAKVSLNNEIKRISCVTNSYIETLVSKNVSNFLSVFLEECAH